MPSDTVYGLSCLALDKDAVERTYELKGRDYDKKLIILLANADQAELLGIDKKELEPAKKFWPGSLTSVVPAGPKTPEFLHRGTNKLPVRVPQNTELRKLIGEVGPIISTSANLKGEPPAKTINEAKKYFVGRVDFYLDAGTLEGQPSTIVELKDGKLVVTRQGAFRLPDSP